jgi:hypothetical protein
LLLPSPAKLASREYATIRPESTIVKPKWNL